MTDHTDSMLELYEKRIRQLAPEVSIDSLTLNREGLLNDVVIVNEELIFRFPKHEYSFKHLKTEANILRLLQNYITLDVPSPLYQSDDCLAYRIIPGNTLRRDVLKRLSEVDQQAVADQLGQFFKELHSVPESLMDRLYGVYPEAETYLQRARFYAGAHEVRWLLTGIERNDPMWFAVHVGGAKDIEY